MAYDIFHGYGLSKIHDSLTENYDYKDNDSSQWKLVKKKEVLDSDGFMTDYCWYTNGDKHIFMFSDAELYEPDEDYADWVAETHAEASDWFDSYEGFSEEDIPSEFEDEIDDIAQGDADFMNEGFNRVYGAGLKLED